MIDAHFDINCLILFILLTKDMNNALHEVQKSSNNLRTSTLKVSSPLQVQQVDWQLKKWQFIKLTTSICPQDKIHVTPEAIAG